MKYYLITIILCIGFNFKSGKQKNELAINWVLITYKIVFGVKCYATDVEKLTGSREIKNISLIIQDCEDNNEDIKTYLAKNKIPFKPGADIGCFSLDVEGGTMLLFSN